VAKELSVSIREAQNGAIIVSLSGSLDSTSGAALDQVLVELEGSGRTKIVMDCAGLEDLSSFASGFFVSHLTRCKVSGGDIRFCDLRPELQPVFTNLGLSKLLVCYDSEQAALASYVPSVTTPARQPEARLSLEREDIGEGIALIKAIGSIDRRTIELLDKELLAALKAGFPKIILDGSELGYISSNGVGVFISFRTKVIARGGDIRFFALKDIVRTVLTTLGLHRMFQLHETREQALKSYAEKA